MNESTLINKYIKPITSSNKEALYLLDDVAFIENNQVVSKSWVVSTDCMIENIHFFKNEDPKSIAYRLIISNISDIITKGAIPKYFTLTFCPKSLQELKPSWVKVFFETIDLLQKKYKFNLIGGNVSITNTVFMCSVTVIGEVSLSKKHALPFRFNAKSDDLIYMSGYAGDAYLGYSIISSKKGLTKKPFWLKYLQKNEIDYLINSYYYPNISVSLGQQLRNIANASTDASDGLLFSLKSICDSFNEKQYIDKKLSNNFLLNIQLNLSFNMFSKAAQKVVALYSSTDLTLLSKLLKWGGDYNLVFSIPKDNIKYVDKIINTELSNNINIVCIGKLLKDNKSKKNISIFDFNNKKIYIKNVNNYRYI